MLWRGEEAWRAGGPCTAEHGRRGHRGERRPRGRRARARGRGRGRPDPRSRAGADRLSAGGPAAAAGVRARLPRGPRGRRRGRAPRRGAHRLRRLERRVLQRRRPRRRRAGAGRLPQAVPAQLRRLRRGPVLRRRRRPAGGRGARGPGGRRDLRGHLVPEPRWPATSPPRASTSICAISASPFHRGKGAWRERMLATRAADCAAYLAFCNQVGGQDELVFDGRSAVFDADGELVARAAPFVEDLLVADLDLRGAARRRLREPLRPAPAAPRGRGRAGRRPRGPQRPTAAAPRRRRPRPGRGRGAVGGPGARGARLRRQERLPGRRDRPVRRHRLGADRGAWRPRRSAPSG